MLIAQVWCSLGCFRDPTFWAKGVTRNFGHIWDKVHRLFIGKLAKFLLDTFAPKTMFLGVISGAELDFDTSRAFLQKSIFDPYMTFGHMGLWFWSKIAKSRNPEKLLLAVWFQKGQNLGMFDPKNRPSGSCFCMEVV